MPKTHFKILGVDRRSQGQTEHEFNHQTACGYVRGRITRNKHEVDCKLCLREIEKNEGVIDTYYDSSM